MELAYEKYADMLYRLALSHLKNPEDAEDTVQEVFVKYMHHFAILTDEEHERAWLIRTTVNRCYDLLRYNSRRNHEALDELTEEIAAEEKEQHIEIKESCGLSDEEIQRMKDDAKANEEADKKRREDVEKINMAEATVFQTRKQIEEMSDKLTDEDKTSLEEKAKNLEEAVNAKDVEKIDVAQKELQEVWYGISAKLYAQAQPEGNPAETILNPDGTAFNPGV